MEEPRETKTKPSLRELGLVGALLAGILLVLAAGASISKFIYIDF